MASNTAINFNHEWTYPLQWIQESEMARLQYQAIIYRVNEMMEGRPFVNTYEKDISSNLEELDNETKRKLGSKCLKVPVGHSLELSDAVRTISNQLASGVDSYEYTINDPFMTIDDDLEQRLATQCSIDYAENDLDLLASTFTSDMLKYGVAAVLTEYDEKTNKNVVSRINAKNIWFDTMYHTNGKQRFVGYSTMISWSKLKCMIEKDKDDVNTSIEAPSSSVFDESGRLKHAKYSNRKIRTLNGLDIYVKDLNRLATTPALQNSLPQLFPEYMHDLRSCYNLNWYRTYASTPEAITNNGYDGMDVELTVIYDLNRKIEFKIINRRFVISMNKHAFRRSLIFPQTNPLTNEKKYRIRECELECPLVLQWLDFDEMDKAPYPTSPLFTLLDIHDKLCGWQARREHVSKILSILRIETNGADASSLKGLFNIMGIVIDDIQGDINSVDFHYSYEPIDSQIAYYTQLIQKHLSAYTQFDALQMVGDRASAAESGMATGAIAQGIATIQNALMKLYSRIAQQCLMNRVIYSPEQAFPIVNNGNYSSLTLQEMALHAIIRVKLAPAKKVVERQLAANAMAILGTMGQEFTPQLKSILIEQALFGQVPRKVVAENIVKPQPSAQELALAQQEATNMATMLQQNQQAYTQDPISYEVDNVIDNFSPSEVEQIITGVSETASAENAPEVLDMEQQDASIAMDLEGNTSELGSMLANPNSLV